MSPLFYKLTSALEWNDVEYSKEQKKKKAFFIGIRVMKQEEEEEDS